MRKTDPFGNHSDRYDEWFEKYPLVYQTELAALKAFLPDQGEGVEIGAGSGRFAVPLGITTGVDPSPEMREIAKNRGLDIWDAVAEKLPFSDHSFDFALMVTSICFVDDLDASFLEAYRILKPGGHVIIGFVDKNSFLGKRYSKNKEKSVFYKSARFYSVNDVVFHLEKAGFLRIQIGQTLFNPLADVNNIQSLEKGYGKGAFVVIRGMKGR